jgi:hypothetical protein
MGGGGSTATYTTHQGTSKVERYVHGSSQVLGPGKLDDAAAENHSVKLQIDDIQPKHLEDAKSLQRDAGRSWTFQWTVEATLNVVRGRDAKASRPIKVSTGSLTKGS